MSTNHSFVIHNADLQEKAHKESSAAVNYTNVDCCQNFTDVGTGYFFFMPTEIIGHNKKHLENWVNLVRDTGFPIGELRKNDLIEPTKRKSIKYFNCTQFQTVMEELTQLVKSGKAVGIKGTNRAGKVYRWTDTNLMKAHIVGVNNQEGVVTIKIDEHKDKELIGEQFDVVIYYFDYLDDSPVMNLDELEKELASTVIKYTPGYLIRMCPEKVSPTNRMMALTLIRYLWADQFEGLINDFFEIQNEIPEGKFFEILLLASAKGNYGGGRGVYNFGETLRPGRPPVDPNSNPGVFPHFKEESLIWKDIKDGKGVNNSVHGVPIKGYISIREFHDDLKNARYRKAYGDMLFYSYGKKSSNANVVEAIETYGFLFKGKSYLVRGENDQSYKVISDDYSLRWYKKDRFKSAKVD